MSCRKVNNSLVFVLFLIFFTFSNVVFADDYLGMTFDQFIDKSSGDEQKKSIAEEKSAYRAKRVNKSILRWIDRVGYYSGFKKDFKDWCEANAGKFRQNQFNDADCTDKQNAWLGAYVFEITTTKTYQGDMTAGYVTFYFYGSNEMTKVFANKLEAEAISKHKQELIIAESQRQSACKLAFQNSLKPGVKTNLGMIIEVKPPLAYVQNLNETPPTKWVEISNIEPPISSNYCVN